MRIGIASPWFERGAAYASLMMYQALREEYDVHVFALAGKPVPVGQEWQVPSMTLGHPREISSWAQCMELDVLILCERQDVFPDRDFKALTLLMWEWVKPSQVPTLNAHFDGILAPTQAAFQHLRDMGIERVFYVPWGADLDTFRPQLNRGPLRFFHPAGYGGVAGRRNTRVVRDAFEAADTGDSQLLITTQRAQGQQASHNSPIRTLRGTLSREALAEHYRESDVALLPSKWEGLGLTLLEALASGLAIVTTDAAPMNEYVQDGFNGFLCPARSGGRPSGIQIPEARIDPVDLIDRIERLSKDIALTRDMGRRSRDLAEAHFDWAKNGQVLASVVERVAHDN